MATVTAGGMALAGGRGLENINEPNTGELRPTAHVLVDASINGKDDGITGRVIEMDQTESVIELLPLSPPRMEVPIMDPVPISNDFDAYTTQVRHRVNLDGLRS